MDFDVRSQARRSLAIVTARLLEHVVGIGRPKDAGESDEASTPNLDPVYQKLRIILKQVAINTDVPDALALAEMISAITPTGAPRLVYEFATAPGPAQWRAVPGVVAWGGSDGRNLALRLIQENDTLLASVALVGLSVSGNDYSDDGPILESVTGHICSNDRDLKAQARRFLIKHAGKWTRENFRWIGTMLSMSIDNETDFVDLLRDASSASLSG